jgi:hypothetical protein
VFNVPTHLPVGKHEREQQLAYLLSLIECQSLYPVCFNLSELRYTVQMFCALIIGALRRYGSDELADIHRWGFIEWCIDSDAACEFMTALSLTPECCGITSLFGDISRRLRRELDCPDSLLYTAHGDIHACLIRHFTCRTPATPDTRPLYYAINTDDIDVFKQLLRQMPVPADGMLGPAVYADATEIARFLLDRYGNRIATTDTVVLACKLGRYRTAKMLLERKPDLAQPEVLTEAILWGHVDIMELLLNYHVKHNLDDSLSCACVVLRDPGPVKLLLARGAKATSIQLAFCWSLPIAELLLATGVDVNQVLDFGATPLIMAAQRDNDELAQLLIDKKAKVNLSNQQGWTALHFAASRGSMRVMRVLLYADVDINAQAIDGTPLDYAYRYGQYLAARILTYAGARV